MTDGTGTQEGRPRLLDLFCGAGGAAMGYHRAGFDVVGVDIEPQPHYPFTFWQVDAMKVLRDGLKIWPTDEDYFDAIHASPPCQLHSLVSGYNGGDRARAIYPELIGPTRDLLREISLPYVIENVIGAPVRADLTLCGEMFGLRLHRHRVFECEGFFPMRQGHAPHALKGAIHNCHIEDGYTRQITGNYADHESASEAMGIDWMNRDELRLAIPPAYTEHIGHYLLRAVRERQASHA